jgi:hypothetical protein
LEEVEEDDNEWMDVKDESKILVSGSFDTTDVVDLDSILSSVLFVYLLLCREATVVVIEEEGGETKGKLGKHGWQIRNGSVVSLIPVDIILPCWNWLLHS